MKKGFVQICAVVMSFVMLFSLLPTSALADEKPLYDISNELYYGRDALSKMENGENLVAAYDAIGKAVKVGAEQVELFDYEIPIDDRNTLKMLFDIYNKDHPEDYVFPKYYSYNYYSEQGTSYVYALFLEYYTGYDKYRFNRMANKFLDAVSGVETEYEKALMLYNILEEYIEYDYSALSGSIYDSNRMKSYSAYGAIVDGKAVCEGYAEAYQYLLQRLGIQSFIVTGTSKEGESHEWNLLKLDGKYYYADVTWDDVGTIDNLYHSYFSITTERLLEGHIISDPYGILPDCLSTEMAYHYDNVFTNYDVTNLAKIFKGDKKKTANFYFAGEQDNFDAWWDKNGDAVFQNISGLIPGVGYYISYRSVGREYLIEVYPQGYGSTIGGTLLSWGDASKNTKIELFALNENTPCYTANLDGNFNFWTLDDVKDGRYTLRISKEEHKSKEYTFKVSGEDVVINGDLFLLGDVTEDGIIDIRDFVREKICIANGIDTPACDVNNDGEVNALDLTETMKKLF